MKIYECINCERLSKSNLDLEECSNCGDIDTMEQIADTDDAAKVRLFKLAFELVISSLYLSSYIDGMKEYWIEKAKIQIKKKGDINDK